MDKKAKSMVNNKPSGGDKGGGTHRDARGHRSFSRSPTFSGRFSQGEPLDKISDPKSNRVAPMRRPKTHPELLNRDKPAFERTPWLNLETPSPFTRKVPPVDSANNKSTARLLINVTVAQSIGPLRVLLSNDATVLDVIKAALALYAKEGRKPVLSSDPLSFGLHYSQFSIDSLDPRSEVKDLGSRNFFMCTKANTAKESNTSSQVSVFSCGTELGRFSRVREPWYRLMDYFFPVP